MGAGPRGSPGHRSRGGEAQSAVQDRSWLRGPGGCREAGAVRDSGSWTSRRHPEPQRSWERSGGRRLGQARGWGGEAGSSARPSGRLRSDGGCRLGLGGAQGWERGEAVHGYQTAALWAEASVAPHGGS